jgi:Helix-turn-helix domain
MPSFQIAIEPNRRAAARFVGQVRRSLQKAFVEEQQKRGLSQSEIARMLKVHRSVINRELKGLKDMTLGRVGELSWAMGRKPFFSAEEPTKALGTNLPVAPQVANTLPAGTKAATSQPITGIPNINIPMASAA